jgi:signal transduction histidine kinase
MLERLGLASMRWQIFLLATLPIFLFATVASIRAPLKEIRHEKSEWASLVAGQILVLADQLRIVASPEGEESVLNTAARRGLKAELTTHNPGEDFDLTSSRARTDFPGSLVEKLVSIAAARGKDTTASGPSLTARVGETRWIIFRPDVPAFSSHAEKLLQSLAAIAFVVLPVLLLSYFLSYRFTRPVMEFAAAARRITLDEDSHEPFSARGTTEIRSLGDSLNVMRDRVNRMIEERTRILYGVGHDLRTPLTRLRMRAERCDNLELRSSMVRDVERLSGMIDDMMLYLRNLRVDTAPPTKVDLSSLLQTTAADYVDMGVSVAFSGPSRLVYACRVRGMMRAISNLIDNASRYAKNIELLLCEREGGGIIVEVRDDGPGLSDDLKRKVLEPFFKGDAARTVGEGGGIGLGLPIASSIAKNHGGTLGLLDNQPRGLCIRIALPPDPIALASTQPALPAKVAAQAQVLI